MPPEVSLVRRIFGPCLHPPDRSHIISMKKDKKSRGGARTARAANSRKISTDSDSSSESAASPSSGNAGRGNRRENREENSFAQINKPPMRSQDHLTPKAKAIFEAVDQIDSAIQAAPLKELTEPVRKDLELEEDESEKCRNLFEYIEILEDLAKLGQPEAISKLVNISRRTAKFVLELFPKGSLQDTKSPEARRDSNLENQESLLDGSVSEEWRKKFDGALDVLRDLGGGDFLTPSIEKLPETEFVDSYFLLPHDDTYVNPHEKRPLAEFCDRLVQKRIYKERSQWLREIAQQATAWPFYVEAPDYLQGKTVIQYAKNLNLGSALSGGFMARSRREKSPSVLAVEVYQVLEKERKWAVGCCPAHLEAMKQGLEAEAPDLLERFIAEAREKVGPRVQTDPGDTRIQHEGSQGAERQSETSHVSCMILDRKLEMLWKRRAAFLPTFSEDDTVIKNWIDAAYAYLAYLCRGDFANYDWTGTVRMRLNRTGGLPSAIKLTLREGFETLSGKDRKK